ncbi:unnamed protein product [Rotaria sp. Silwood1]|nr:unnamed protein product [Rotaria sp. Silwood1]CAF1410726.1 unnamed protein product [Rotaria sp. Silwood1]CAF3599740.1 unnamed protein product [Rotaria sp. Silwood1]CAF5013988.1 unnamed protein product [Rotaria sp. Silwood1]
MEIEVGNVRPFSVKSYLDDVYDRQSHSGQHESLRHRYLISSRRSKFFNYWWKLPLWFGSFFILFGISLLLIGFLLPRKKIDINSQSIIIDRQAIAYNTNLDRSHLCGICFVVAGSALFFLSLIISTFRNRCCAASRDSNDEIDS